MEEGRAHEEVAPAAPRGRRLARPVFLAAVALALLSFAAIVSGAEISSALEQTRGMIGAKARVPTPTRRRLRGTEAPVWFASLRAASRSERRAREDREFAALRSISDVAHEATRVGSRVKDPIIVESDKPTSRRWRGGRRDEKDVMIFTRAGGRGADREPRPPHAHQG